MTGHKIKIGRAQFKNGRLTIPTVYRDAAHKIRSRKSKKSRAVTPGAALTHNAKRGDHG